MSSKERSPENNRNIEGNENQAVQGGHNQVIQGINNFFIGFFHIFPFTTPSHSSSRRKLTKRQKWIMGGCGSVALLTVAGFTVPGIIDILQPKDASNFQGISLGEEILIEPNISIEKKQELEKAFSNKDYQQFRYLLGDYLKQNPNSPELWVYWNNAKAALLSEEDPIKIAVSIPIGTTQNIAEEILRGVALAQNEFNNGNNETGINGRLLKVVIANDDNQAELAKQVAQRFVQDPSILAVVGHNASNASLAAKDTYIGKKLVMVTPTSFSDRLQGDPYIFRMVPQISYFANQLARYIEQENPNSIVGICMDPGTVDNDSFGSQFEAVFPHKTFNLPCDFLDQELTDDSLNKEVKNILEEIKLQKINSVVLAPYVGRIPEISEIFQDIHSTNSSIRLYGSPTFFTQETLKAGQAAEGLTLSVPWYPNKDEPENVQFQQKFQQLYQATTDNWRTAMAYDATGIILMGLEQISNEKQQIEREQLNNVLREKGNSYDGATGKTEFSDSGVNDNKSDVIIQIKNGQFENAIAIRNYM